MGQSTGQSRGVSMATLERRTNHDGTVSYRVKVRLLGQSQTATFPSRLEAKKWATITEASIREGKYSVSQMNKSITLGDAITRYREQQQLIDKPITRAVQSMLNYWSRIFGNINMSQ